MRRRAAFEEQRDLTRLLVGRSGRLASPMGHATVRQHVRLATAVLLGDDRRLATVADPVRRTLAAQSPATLLDFWREERIGALAISRARAHLDLSDPSWDSAARELQEASDQSAGMTDLILIEATRRFESCGIRSVLLKGRALAGRLYEQPSLRSASQDVDVLVPTSRIFDAARICEEMGWQAARDPIVANGLPPLHLSMPRTGALPMIEIHWRVQWYDDGHAAGLLDRAQRSEGLPVLAPTDLLDVLLLAWARDGFRRLRLGADIAAWWRRYGGEVERDEVEKLLSVPGTGRPATIAARAAADLFGTPEPSRAPNRGDARAKLALAIAHTDAPLRAAPRAHTQPAIVDLLVCERRMLGRRVAQGLFMEPALIRKTHPWVPTWLIAPMRAASAGRTVVGGVPIVLRAARYRRLRLLVS